jgi:hypothetical protein
MLTAIAKLKADGYAPAFVAKRHRSKTQCAGHLTA